MSGEFKFVTIGENQGGKVEVAKSHCEGEERARPVRSHLGEKVKKLVSGKSGVILPNVVTSFIETLEANKLLKMEYRAELSMLSGAPQRGFHKGVHDFELLSNGDCRIYVAAGATGGCSGRCQCGSEVVLRISNRRSQGSSDAESAE